jgi:hypothetical protein
MRSRFVAFLDGKPVSTFPENALTQAFRTLAPVNSSGRSRIPLFPQVLATSAPCRAAELCHADFVFAGLLGRTLLHTACTLRRVSSSAPKQFEKDNADSWSRFPRDSSEIVEMELRRIAGRWLCQRSEKQRWMHAMQDAKEYWRYAEECERIAREGPPEHRETLLGIAKAWRRHARLAEAEDTAKPVSIDGDGSSVGT